MKYIDLNKLETSLTSAIKNVIALNADGEIIKAQFDPADMGGGSVDNAEIEKINQSIDALDERLTKIDLTQFEQATSGSEIKVSAIKRIAESATYSTDFVIKGITINQAHNNNVRIISSRVTKNPILPTLNYWMIWGLVFDGTSLYVVSWVAEGTITDDSSVQATVTKLF